MRPPWNQGPQKFVDDVSGTTLGTVAAQGTQAPGPWAGTRPTPPGE